MRKNADPHFNRSNNNRIPSKMIIYGHKNTAIKVRIQGGIDFLGKKKLKALMKTIFSLTVFFTLQATKVQN